MMFYKKLVAGFHLDKQDRKFLFEWLRSIYRSISIKRSLQISGHFFSQSDLFILSIEFKVVRRLGYLREVSHYGEFESRSRNMVDTSSICSPITLLIVFVVSSAIVETKSNKSDLIAFHMSVE